MSLIEGRIAGTKERLLFSYSCHDEVRHRSINAVFSDLKIPVTDKSIERPHHAECEWKFWGSPGEQVHALTLYSANLITGVHQVRQGYLGKTHLPRIMREVLAF